VVIEALLLKTTEVVYNIKDFEKIAYKKNIFKACDLVARDSWRIDFKQ
jgi:hypothetical protein